jgi:hypothetical protein
MIVAAAEKVESSRNVHQSFRKTTLLSYVVLCCLGYSGSARKKKRRLQSRAMQQCGSTRATTCNLKQTRKGGRVSEMELPFAFVVSRRGGNLPFTITRVACLPDWDGEKKSAAPHMAAPQSAAPQSGGKLKTEPVTEVEIEVE